MSSLPRSLSKLPEILTIDAANNSVAVRNISSNVITFGDGTKLSSNASIVLAYDKANAAYNYANTLITGLTYTASNTAPSTPKLGDQWYFISRDIVYEWSTNGTTSFWLDTLSSAITSSYTISGGGSTGGPGIFDSVVSNTYIAIPYATQVTSIAYANTIGSNTLIDHFDTEYFRSANYQIQIENEDEYQASQVLVLYTNYEAKVNEYSILCSNTSLSSLGTFYANVSGTLVNLYYNPVQANNVIISNKVGMSRIKSHVPPDLITGTNTIDLTQGSTIIDMN